MALLTVSVDLDGLHCYHRAFGLGAPRGDTAHVVYRRALPRIARFLEEEQIVATVFVVGKDLLENPEAGAVLRDLTFRGFELGNHTFSHRFDLAALTSAEQRRELIDAEHAIVSATGTRPVGFRAPGYNLHRGLVALLERHNYLYDSSIFPCPSHFVGRAVTVGVNKLTHALSEQLLFDPRLLGAPLYPFRIGADAVWSRGSGMAEIPLSVVTSARWPLTARSLAVMTALPAGLAARSASKQPFINLQVSGTDFIDADADGLAYLKRHLPHLRIPLERRKEILRKVVGTLTEKQMEPVTLADAARRLLL